MGIMKTTCSDCDGTGVCQDCHGDGKKQAYDNRGTCSCGGSGRCPKCQGSGLVDDPLDFG